MRHEARRFAKFLVAAAAAVMLLQTSDGLAQERHADRPNILLILADDLGFSDIGCYGSEIATPNLDRLAAGGLRFTQFYNAARCCPTRAALLTGLYPHQAGVGHMLQDWKKPAYTTGLNERCATIAELLRDAGYRTYMVGKWHVGRPAGPKPDGRPLDRGFEHFYGTGGGGNYFVPKPLVRDSQQIEPEGDYYITDALSDNAVKFIEGHGREHKGDPFFLHLCYTAPHFPLHARPEDIAKYRGKYRDGWDAVRKRRYARQLKLGIIDPRWKLSPRDPVAQAWSDADQKDEWDLRMAVFAAMVDRMDRGIGNVLDAVKRIGAEENTLVLFLSDNGSSAEALDSWPNPARGHKPGSVTGTKDSHRCLEVGWANAGNTPFREHKMWVHEGGIATPLIAYWPTRIPAKGKLTGEVGHVIDLMPTCLEVAGAKYPKTFQGRELTPVEGKSLMSVFRGDSRSDYQPLFWEHEGNRAVRQGNWKLVAEFRGPWQLYDLAADRTELNNLAAKMPDKVNELSAVWQQWADKVGAVPWETLPGSSYKPTAGYRKKSEPVAAEKASAKPNILVIMSDDLGYADVGFQGCKDIPTPNLDTLARQAVRCTSGYVSHPFCSPTRAGLLTGRYQQRFGHENNPAYLPNDDRVGLPVGEITLAQLLREAGYVTGAVGKWHLGAAPPFHPNRRGFMEWFGHIGGGHVYLPGVKGGAEYVVPIMRNDEPQEHQEYLTPLFGREAAAFVQRHRDRPWFLYLAFNAPHTPLQAPPELLEKFRHISDPNRRTYAAMVYAMDAAIGTVLTALRDAGAEQNTLIFFLSDNGGPLVQQIGPFTDNAPLRGHKGQVYEGGIRVPFLVRWPARLAAGRTYDRPVISLDIFSTALAAAAASSPSGRPIDGVNLLPHLAGERADDPHEFLFWRAGGPSGNLAARTGNWKLVRSPNGNEQLFNLHDDIAESKDLAASQPAVLAKLRGALDAWNRQLATPLWQNPQPAKKKSVKK